MATKICKLCLLRKKIASCASYRVVRLLNTSTAQKSKPNRFDADETESNKTHFGFKTVDKDEKQGKVNEVFENVAEKYDLMNDVMSAGIHRLWKDQFMERLAPQPGTKLIDVAGGTGDIAFRFLKFVENEVAARGEILERSARDSSTLWSQMNVNSQDKQDYINFQKDVTWKLQLAQLDLAQVQSNSEANSDGEEETSSIHGTTQVTVCDINPAMLEVGENKARELGYSEGVSWIVGNAENLAEIESDSYDAYTIAFGIRNCTNIDKVLAEAHRVLKPGGRFMCLEFSHVPNPVLRWVYDEYSFQVIPPMGQVVARDWHSYQYLVESIRRFPKQEEFTSMIKDAGFKAVHYENLSFGIAAIHSGFKLKHFMGDTRVSWEPEHY